ncbi:MAG: carboxymuconolactone decarboxylase family protein [Planctomycetes bacterium]|nr:carboxymuconolactone decarboxylase family protein [Planctomycetota bacterium]
MSELPSVERLRAALANAAPLDARAALLCAVLGALAVSERELLAAAFDLAREIGIERAALEELLLQGTLFGGFPRTVEAFQLLRTRWGPRAPMPAIPRPAPEPAFAAGEALFDRIYAELAPAVRRELFELHPALAHWIAEHAYRAVLARTELDAATRELAAVTALAASGCRRQLLSHARGAVRCGAAVEEVRAAFRLAGLFRSAANLAELEVQVERALLAVADREREA